MAVQCLKNVMNLWAAPPHPGNVLGYSLGWMGKTFIPPKTCFSWRCWRILIVEKFWCFL